MVLLLLVLFTGCRPRFEALEFDATSKNIEVRFWYEQNDSNAYLDSLRADYPVESLVGDADTDTEKVERILHWVAKQWRHDGNNEPRKNDALSILEEVGEGKNFRCVEYAIVASACLNAVGLKARTLGLMTSDVETRKSGAGHVAVEVYLDDLEKWVFVDPQWDAIPVLDGIPLNAVEFQQALTRDLDRLEIRSSRISKNDYIGWVYPYLYFFTVSFDNRESLTTKRKGIKGKTKLMLVPLGSGNPTVFQRDQPINYAIYTHALLDFYAPFDMDEIASDRAAL